jgi:phospholipid-translocating ATPase
LIVLSITALKDGYEDVKRHQSDRQVNHSMARVLAGGNWTNPNAMASKSKTFVRGIIPKNASLRPGKNSTDREELKGVTSVQFEDPGIEFDDIPHHSQSHTQPQSHHYGLHRGSHGRYGDLTRAHWRKTPWEDVAVGDFVKILNNEPIPADVLICSTSEDENVAYVETKGLDGETNLKSRHAVAALTHIRSAADCATTHNSFRIDCDRPDTNMYKLNAAVRVGKETFPVDMQTMLLRGTMLRNTEWIIGIVLYTGEDTRIVMNAGGTPSKRSKVERQMNPQVYVVKHYIPLRVYFWS